MKIFIFFVLSVISIEAKSQIRLLKKSEDLVKTAMSKDTSLILDERATDGGLTYLWYLKKHSVPTNYNYTDGYNEIVFYFKDNQCIMYQIIDLIRKLPKYVATLNKDYIKIDEDTWVDKDYTHAYEIKIVDTSLLSLYVRPL